MAFMAIITIGRRMMGPKGERLPHSGSNEGFIANISAYLDHDLIVVSLSNEKPSNISDLYNQLANAVLGFEEPIPTENFLNQLTTKVLSNKPEEAMALFSQAQRTGRWDLPSKIQLNRLGYIYLENGYLNEAEKLFLFLTQAYPDYKNGWDSYAEALESNNKVDVANKIRKAHLHITP